MNESLIVVGILSVILIVLLIIHYRTIRQI